MKSNVKKLVKDCEYCAKVISKDTISPNIVMHVLSQDPAVKANLLENHADIKVLAYILNPYHLRKAKPVKPVISTEVKEIISHIEEKDTQLDIFKKALQFRYISEILAKAGYMPGSGEDTILSKYTRKVSGRFVKEVEVEKYERIEKHLGKQNIMIMGAIGSGRYEFIRNFALYNKSKFSILYFDMFSYLKFDEERLFAIISGIFDELGDNYLYIPNFLQVISWTKSLKMHSVYTLLHELSIQGKIITKVNKNNFDPKQFHISKQFNFFSVNVPETSFTDLFDMLHTASSVYEKFYDISISKEMIRSIIKDSNFYDTDLSQPGKSLKRLMHKSLTLYGEDNDLLAKPKGKENILEGIDLSNRLKRSVIGQDKPMDEIAYDIGKTNLLEGGIARSFLFQGEIGCGKLKCAREISKLLFGEGSLRYIDLGMYATYPYKFKLYPALDAMIATLFGGIVFLDNFDALDTKEVAIFEYIDMKMKEMDVADITAPVIIIASVRRKVTDIANYPYIIEHFDNIVYFNKLTMRDLEKIADIQLRKVKDFVEPGKDISSFLISANANTTLNALGVKKLITLMSL